MTRVKRMRDRAEIELRYWAENEAELALDGRRHDFGWRRSVHRREGRQDGVDASDVPRWRPRRSGEILEDERRSEPVVVPAEQPWEERLPVERRIDAVLLAQPIRGVVERGDLHERGMSLLQVDDESSVGRGAVPGRGTPGDRRRTQRAAHPVEIGGLGLHASEAIDVLPGLVGSIDRHDGHGDGRIGAPRPGDRGGARGS